MAKRTTAKRTTSRRKTARRKLSPAAESNGHVRDGTLTFVIRGGQHDGQEIKMDATLVKVTAQELEQRHRLREENGQLYPTADFLRDLSMALEDLGYPSTPTIAHRVWIEASSYFAEVQKKTN